MYRTLVFGFLGTLFLANLAVAESLQSLEVYPSRVQLDGPRAQQRLGVLAIFANGQQKEFTSAAKFTSGDSQIAKVDEQGIVQPVSDGTTKIHVVAEGVNRQVPVEVTKAKADVLVEFGRDIVPIFTRQGCNQGACHGAQHGRGGFKLSLLGFDPIFDHAQVVQSAEGRRVVVSDPERSILLLKPSLVMEHGGGHRLQKDGQAYDLIRQWLEDGVPEPSRRDPVVTKLQVWPRHRTMSPKEKQQILVTATWSDGVEQDVTSTAQFDTLNEGVAKVTKDGLITAQGKGETHIMVRFGGQATVVQVTLPYAKVTSFPKFASNNFIDEKAMGKWKSLGLTPSELCSDLEFYRRIHLDTIGTLPSPKSIRAFLSDKSEYKRKKAIEKVLDRPEFVDFWALKLGDLLRINRNSMQDRGMWSFHNWVRSSIRDGKSLDKMASEIITAEGSTFTEGPANFFMTSRNPADWAETTSQVFLGVRIGCAKCHHHPFEKWSQDDYYGMTAFFVRVGTKTSKEFGLFGRETVVYLRNGGEQTHPRKGGIVKPHPLGSKETDDPLDRRVALAKWMTAKENDYFARNLVNRFWGYYMGRGLVEPLDDLRATNPASNPELLDALAENFVKHNFDLKHLLRTIMNSRVYQLSSKVTAENKVDAANMFYTRFTIRRLTAEQLADAIDAATGTTTKYTGLPLGTRAIQLPDSQVASFFLDTFGRPERKITCECERTKEPNIAQALHLLHGDFLNPKLSHPKGRLANLLKAKTKDTEAITELYLATLSRPPSSSEINRAKFWITQAPNRREGLEDVLWALLNSREFVFTH
ncbi:MAG: DUF1553 domain-containing protein [Gemmataceae bacterium]